MNQGGLIFDIVHHFSGASLPGQYLALLQKQAYTPAGNWLRGMPCPELT